MGNSTNITAATAGSKRSKRRAALASMGKDAYEAAKQEKRSRQLEHERAKVESAKRLSDNLATAPIKEIARSRIDATDRITKYNILEHRLRGERKVTGASEELSSITETASDTATSSSTEKDQQPMIAPMEKSLSPEISVRTKQRTAKISADEERYAVWRMLGID